VTTATLRERAVDELRLYAIVSGYLYLCFAALLFFEATLQPDAGVPLAPHGFAAIKALVVGKFLLIGRAVGAGTRLPAVTVAGRIGLRTLGLLVILAVLTLLEEMIVGAMHGRAVGSTVAEVFGHPRYSFFAKCAVMTLVLLPMVAFEELDRALGKGVLRRTLSRRRPT
jgi:hypothetical protein